MDKYLQIVNKNQAYKKEDFKDFKYISGIEVNYPDEGEVAFIEQATYDAYIELKKFLKTKNIPCSLNSAGRSVRAQESTQQEIFDNCIKNYEKQYSHDEAVSLANAEVERTVAKPGHSEHHTGLAIDLSPKIVGKNIATKAIAKIYNNKFLRKNYEYLAKVAPQFGFIVRYTKENAESTGVNRAEPWHLRYVGKEHAKAIAEKMKADPTYSLEKYVLELQNLEDLNVAL